MLSEFSGVESQFCKQPDTAGDFSTRPAEIISYPHFSGQNSQVGFCGAWEWAPHIHRRELSWKPPGESPETAAARPPDPPPPTLTPHEQQQRGGQAPRAGASRVYPPSHSR